DRDVGFESPDISMVERRTHVPARVHETKGQDHRERSGVDRPSHINVLGMTSKPASPTSLAENASHGRFVCVDAFVRP
ncbi:MAG TPA: hypothetical protein VFH17_01870, partial [Coriobacteriia bacterium]|nr:hypothetical protein [Coriobacteriia bacterium]